MKKRITIYTIAIMLISLFWKMNVYAATASLSVSSGSVYVGDTFTVSVNVSAAAWNVHVSSSGPVSGCTIDEADASSDAKDTSKTFSAQCTATGTGTISISLSGDVTSQSGQTSYPNSSRSITVTNRPAPQPSPSPVPSYDPTPYTPPQETPQQEEPQKEETEQEVVPEYPELNITSFEIVGYEIPFSKDRLEYDIDIANSVNKLDIVVKGENITIEGDGIIDINDKNEIEVKISNPEGNAKTYIIRLNRKPLGTNNQQPVVAKEESNDFNIYFYTTIAFGGISLLLLIALLARKKSNGKAKEDNSSLNNNSLDSIATPVSNIPGDIANPVVQDIATPVSQPLPDIATPVAPPVVTPAPQQQGIASNASPVNPANQQQGIASNASPVNPANQQQAPVATQTSVTSLPSDVRAILK